jgi:hypothetical protein
MPRRSADILRRSSTRLALLTTLTMVQSAPPVGNAPDITP